MNAQVDYVVDRTFKVCVCIDYKYSVGMERTIENTKPLLEAGQSVRAVAEVFGVSTTAMRTWLRRRGLNSLLRKRSWTDEQLVEAVKTSTTMMDVMRKLNLKPYAGNNNQLKRRCSILGVDLSHFTGRGHGQTAPRTMRPTELIFVRDSPATQVSAKKRILKESLLEHRCAVCGLAPTWRGLGLVLVLDHISGDSSDYRLENLRFLCPNCNSQQTTFCRGQRKLANQATCQHIVT